jgi:TorA maturation chaperone TorD
MTTNVCDKRTYDEALATGAVYGLLARLWSAEPCHDTLEQLQQPLLGAALLAATGYQPPANTSAALDVLAVDYCQLFVGPTGHLPPYQSVWETGQFGSAAVASMNKFQELFGNDQKMSRSGSPMSDHLGVQLLWMHELHSRFLADGLDGPQAQVMQEMKQVFFAAHLNWPGKLLRGAMAKAKSDFYRAVVGLTSDFLDEESRMLLGRSLSVGTMRKP